MKRVLVIGAGAQGGPCNSILAREPDVEEIRLENYSEPLMLLIDSKYVQVPIFMKYITQTS